MCFIGTQCWARTATMIGKALLPQSTRVFNLRKLGVSGGRVVDHPWLSDDALLNYGPDGRLYRYDINRRTNKQLVALSTRVTRSAHSDYDLAASPNGPWVLWKDDVSHTTFAASIDGKHKLSWNHQPGRYEPYWFLDGRHWLLAPLPVNTQGSTAIEYDINNADVNLPLKFPSRGYSPLIQAAVSAKAIITVDSQTVHMGMGYAGATYPVTVDVVNVTNLGLSKQYKVNLANDLGGLIVSPDGKWIAFFTYREGPSPYRPPTRAERAHGFPDIEDLWVSRIDGRQMSLMGSINQSTGSAQLLDWSPDDKHIAFQYNGALWIVHTRLSEQFELVRQTRKESFRVIKRTLNMPQNHV
jgi:hypothetical protein